ncbi:MAG: tryptophan transporter [Peptoniphilus sp.]|nr:tryptophan transporter [Peptoniphilus sp.]MDD7363062.1 tryptophan transporter [Bacillota bacterium]MDY6045327.1 tryptophan transporter [Peptoniphilus sp.]
MSTKSLVQGAIFIALGTIFHYIVPGFFYGMRPDFLLFFMVAYIVIYPDIKHTLAIGAAMAVMSAITTTFPGGQIANLIDKPITALFAMFMCRNVLKEGIVKRTILYFISTIVSGTVFLLAAMLIVGLPGGAPFAALFVTVVLPTAALNAVMGIVYERVIGGRLKSSRAR